MAGVCPVCGERVPHVNDQVIERCQGLWRAGGYACRAQAEQTLSPEDLRRMFNQPDQPDQVELKTAQAATWDIGRGGRTRSEPMQSTRYCEAETWNEPIDQAAGPQRDQGCEAAMGLLEQVCWDAALGLALAAGVAVVASVGLVAGVWLLHRHVTRG
jgi:hypothetical protein